MNLPEVKFDHNYALSRPDGHPPIIYFLFPMRPKGLELMRQHGTRRGGTHAEVAHMEERAFLLDGTLNSVVEVRAGARLHSFHPDETKSIIMIELHFR